MNALTTDQTRISVCVALLLSSVSTLTQPASADVGSFVLPEDFLVDIEAIREAFGGPQVPVALPAPEPEPEQKPEPQPKKPEVAQKPKAAPVITPPTVTIQASPNPVTAGDSVTIRWQSTNADTCYASGAWQGNKPASGTQRTKPLVDDATYHLSCSNKVGGTMSRVNVSVRSPAGVSLTLNANRKAVRQGRKVELSWQSENADRCVASGSWKGNRPQEGKFDTKPLDDTSTFKLTCSNSHNTATAIVSVAVRKPILKWREPTSSQDGSPVDIAGYWIYWGTESLAYDDSAYIPGEQTEWWASLPPGDYYFAMTTVDTAGLESDLSPEVLITVE